jgi:hypothetical protein
MPLCRVSLFLIVILSVVMFIVIILNALVLIVAFFNCCSATMLSVVVMLNAYIPNVLAPHRQLKNHTEKCSFSERHVFEIVSKWVWFHFFTVFNIICILPMQANKATKSTDCIHPQWSQSRPKGHFWHNDRIPSGRIQGILKGKYLCTVDLLSDWFGISCMATDNFCFYLQNRTIWISQNRRSVVQWYFPL